MEAIRTVPDEQWLGAKSFGSLQITERMIQLTSWEKPRRVVLGRRHHGCKKSKASRKKGNSKTCCKESCTCEEKSKKVKLFTKRICVGVYILNIRSFCFRDVIELFDQKMD